MGIADLDADETPEATAARIQRVIAAGSEVFEARHRRKDGTILPLEVSTTFMEERGGQFVCFGRDLTDRKQREARIALLAQMLDEAPASITIHDTNTGASSSPIARPSDSMGTITPPISYLRASSDWIHPRARPCWRSGSARSPQKERPVSKSGIIARVVRFFR